MEGCLFISRTVVWTANRKFNLGHNRLAEGKKRKARKMVFLALRYLHFSKQLIDAVYTFGLD